MSKEVIVAIISSLFGGLLVGLLNHLFARHKTTAEAAKIQAEAEKIKVETAKLLKEMNTKDAKSDEGSKMPEGWYATGSHPQFYEMGRDRNVVHSGEASGYIKSLKASDGFGSLIQSFKADRFRGKRLRFSGYVKSERVADWAGLWMRIDGPERQDRQDVTLSFDNMQNRPIGGTRDWSKYEIVLDVPDESVLIAFGALLVGEGQVWIDDLNFDVVDQSIPTTELPAENELPEHPLNLGFES